jgi:1A family penicillin-binding protein
MVRQGKYTRRVTPIKRAKWKARGRFRWWKSMSTKRKIVTVVGTALALLILIPLLTYAFFARDISNKDRLMNRNNTGVVLLARGGEEIYSTGKAKHANLLKLAQISDFTENALISSEDKNFYEHSGFSVGSTVAALYANFATGGGSSYGGSTLTQQLAKNTLLSTDKNYFRKFQELSIAIAIERTYSKDEILEMYLNSVFFGENSFGIEDAAKTYFGKSANELDLAQSAMLIGVLPAPSAYSPISGNPAYAKERQTTVLTRMVSNGYISEADKQAALAEQLTYMPAKSTTDTSPAPHYAQMVLQQLYDKYGEEKVTRSGYQVRTTLDLSMQNQLKASIDDHISYIERNGGSNAGGIAIDPTTGEIRALVGSADWNNETWGKVNMATTARQPGSSFKPIYYSEALATGVITPATILRDEPTDFGGGYKPQNASRTYSGDISVRNALSRSLNIPSVKVMQKLGISKAVAAATRMGITTIDDKKTDYGLSLALGSAEAPLIEMTNAYAAFANAGQQFAPTSIKEIDSKFDDRVFSANEKSKNVINPEGAYLISNILSDNNARAPIFGSSLTVSGKTAAVKTGTTDDSRDAWTIGYTPQIALGIWVGNNDNAIMRNGGSGMAGPIWVSTMRQALASTPNTPFTVPSGVVQRNVCSNGSLSNSEIKGKTHLEYFLSTALPTASCNDKPIEDKPAEKPKEDDEDNEQTGPTETTVSLAASPSSTAQFGMQVTLTATVTGPSPVGTVTFKDGNKKLGTVSVNNGTAVFSTSTLVPGSHSLSTEFKPSDSSGDSINSQTIPYTITISGSGGGQGSGNQ